MRISYVRIFVTDLAAAKKFYAQTLGLNILWEYENKAIGFDLGPVLIVEQRVIRGRPRGAAPCRPLRWMLD